MNVLTQNGMKRVGLPIDDTALTYLAGMGIAPKSDLATDKWIKALKTSNVSVLLLSGSNREDFASTGKLTGCWGQPLMIHLEAATEFSTKDSAGSAWTIAQDDPLTISEQAGELGLICKGASTNCIHGRVIQYVASPVKLIIVWNMYSEHLLA